MNGKYLGKIASVRFGYGGYQDSQFGLSVELSYDGCGCGDFIGMWSIEIEVGPHTKWSEKDRDSGFATTMRRINQFLKEAKKEDVYQLKGVPIEVEIEGNALKSWRILTEVL